MPVNRANRAVAYHAIDTERAYQEARWPDRPGIPPHTIDEYVMYIQGYVTRMVEVASATTSPAKKLDVMRKVAGLCVACFEQHGVPCREGIEVPSTLSERIEVLHKKALDAKANGELAVKVGSEEYRDLVDAGVLETWRRPDGQYSFQSYQGLVLDRLDD